MDGIVMEVLQLPEIIATKFVTMEKISINMLVIMVVQPQMEMDAQQVAHLKQVMAAAVVHLLIMIHAMIFAVIT
jgi:hypothetical protein